MNEGRLVVAAVAIATTLTGCSDAKDAADRRPSTGCLRAVAAAGATPGGAERLYERRLTRSLDACDSTDEWLAAAKKHPAVAVAASAEFVEVSFLEIACHPTRNRQTAVCLDGAARGILDGRP